MTQSQIDPPSTPECRFCHRRLLTTEYLVDGQPVCAQCAGQVEKVLELNEFRAGPFSIGVLYGLAAALLCGFAWAVIVKVTHAEIGILAIGIGYVVTRAVLIGTGGRRGEAVQAAAVGLSLIGVAVGKILTAAWVFREPTPKDWLVGADPLLRRVTAIAMAPMRHFEMFDLVWYGLAAYQAWRMAKPIRLNLQRMTGWGSSTDTTVPSPHSQAQSPSKAPLDYAPPQPAPAARSRPPAPLAQAILITLVSAGFSAFIYAQEEGWVFAIGSVLCIMIHELGHTTACLLYGLPASSPIFIPYVGALISLRAQPPNAKVEAVIGIAGPVGGLIAATVCFIWYRTTHSTLAASLVQFGALINLFNLLPIHPLDGGRIARGVAPTFWMIFTLPVAAFCALAPKIGIRQEVAILLTVITAFGIFRTLMRRKGAYYEISALAGWLTGISYAGIAVVLLWMWVQVRDVASIF